MDRGINVIIPIGGIGTRFKNEGYTQPKPLINVMGKPMIFWLLDNIFLNKNDTIYIPYQGVLDHFSFQYQIESRYKDKNIIFIKLDKPTRGACETIKYALDHPQIDLNAPTITLDCDTFYIDNIIDIFRNISNNVIFYSINTDVNPLFSYITISDDLVTKIKEKEKISDFANVGSYGFKSGHILIKYIEKVLSCKDLNEQYVSSIYNKMLDHNEKIYSRKIENFHCIGTPNQIKLFSNKKLDKLQHKYRFCFDLDNTLLTNPIVNGDYNTVRPIERNINFLNFLKSMGHYIIIHTARRMKTHNGDVDLVIEDVGEITIETLKKYNINYDELIFGKPYANFYIDDLSVNPHNDLEKEIGFYNIDIPSRNFNIVKIEDNHVIKTTNNPCEIMWYVNVPNTLKTWIPKYNIIDENTIKLERIEGIPISHLYIKEQLTENTFKNILKSINTIHQSNSVEPTNEQLNFYEKKLENRMSTYNYYVHTNFHEYLIKLKKLLSSYVDNIKYNFTIIHGDPVFSNILLKPNDDLKFIDMRGSFSDQCDIHGDPKYDYSKIYQSIYGYDSIMLGIAVSNSYKLEIERILFDHVSKIYGMESIRDMILLTAYLYLTLIPLHDDIPKINEYYQLFQKLMDRL